MGAILLRCRMSFAAGDAGNANVDSGYSIANDKATATTNQTPNAFGNAAAAYNDSWAAQGCSREAWTELTNAYNSSMNEVKAKSQVLDQRMFDGIKSPKDINLKGFEFLGCDLSGSFDNLQGLYEQARSIMGSYSSGDFKGQIWNQMKTQALNIAKKYAQQQISRACSKVQSEIAQIDNQLFGEVNKVTQQYSDPAGMATQMMKQAAQQAAQRGSNP